MSWLRAIHADSSISTALCLVIDEAQRFGLLSRISQSLADRVGILQLLPFAVEELNAASIPLISARWDGYLVYGGDTESRNRPTAIIPWNRAGLTPGIAG